VKVLVTGAAGFIGSHTAEALLARGDAVTAVDSFDDYYDPARKRATWAELAKAGGSRARLVEGDLGVKGLAKELVAGQDVVVHLAARPGVRASIEDPRRTFKANVDATLEVLEALRAEGAPKRLIFGSTSSVYGGDAPVPFEEDRPSSRPLSTYAASKRAAELLIATYVELFGLGAFALRFFTVYGPRGRPDMSIGKFVEACLRGQRVPLFGDGSITRDFTYIDDIVKGIVAAADRVKPREMSIANLGGSERHSMKELIALIEKECGRELLIDRKPPAPGDAPTTWASVARAEKLLGWRPSVKLEDGVARTVAWAKQKL
jgi:UDP-glucuronate 4-epimerase